MVVAEARESLGDGTDRQIPRRVRYGRAMIVAFGSVIYAPRPFSNYHFHFFNQVHNNAVPFIELNQVHDSLLTTRSRQRILVETRFLHTSVGNID